MQNAAIACPVIDSVQIAIRNAPGNTVSLNQLLNTLGQRSFGVLLLMLSLPAMLPVPGVVSLFGAVLLLLGAQMLLGLSHPWLPATVSHKQLSQKQLLKMLGHVQKPLRFLQPYIHRRLPGLVRKHGEKLAGLFIIIQALLIIVPLPFTNELPAFCLVLLALAFIQQDGLLALLSHALSVVVMTVTLKVYHTVLLAAYTAVLSWL
jgi:hypothetical protein